MIEPLIISLLEVDATTGISANLLDSDGTGLPIHHQRIPQGNSKNGVVFNVISQTPNYRHHIGTATTIAVQDECLVQFDIHHELDSEAAIIADNLRNILEWKSGTAAGFTYNTIVMTGQRSGYNDDQRLPKKSQDYQIRINRN